MSKPRRNRPSLSLDHTLFAAKPRKPVPHQFVLDALAPLSPWTRPMFGCLAIYIDEKIVLILRDKPTYTADNGVWLATIEEHHPSLRREFPKMRSIGLLGKKVTGWQLLPVDVADFEEAALHACDLVLAGDPRIGKIPASRRTSKPAKKKAKPSGPPPSPRNSAKSRRKKSRR
ncbi:MAG: hypothetical protein WCC99_22155 [Candidatus Sulfotelmatobacter sp.]